MKNQLLGTFFYMLYMVAMIQPIMPLIEYETNKEYIASVLCENRNKPQLACNGKCYLKKKFEESNDEKSHDHSLPKIDFSKYPVSIVEDITYNLKEERTSYKHQFFGIDSHPKGVATSLLRPPIV